MDGVRKDGPAFAKLGDRGFLAELGKRAGGILGDMELVAPRMTYPLGFHHSARIVADRIALVGDAAHGIHPIAGQGLNLGLRDVAALTEVLVEGRGSGSTSAMRRCSRATSAGAGSTI